MCYYLISVVIAWGICLIVDVRTSRLASNYQFRPFWYLFFASFWPIAFPMLGLFTLADILADAWERINWDNLSKKIYTALKKDD
jgi:hypothetical protein